MEKKIKFGHKQNRIFRRGMINTSLRRNHRKSIKEQNFHRSCQDGEALKKTKRVKFIHTKKLKKIEGITHFTSHDSSCGKTPSSVSFHNRTGRSTMRRSINYDPSTGRKISSIANSTNRSYSKPHEGGITRAGSIVSSHRHFSSTRKSENTTRNEIVHPKKFSQLNDFFHFKYKKEKSKRDKLKELLSKHYTSNQIIGLLSICHERTIKRGTIIKERDQEFTFADTSSKFWQESTSSIADSDQNLPLKEEPAEVFVIKSGLMGLYVYSYGDK